MIMSVAMRISVAKVVLFHTSLVHVRQNKDYFKYLTITMYMCTIVNHTI